MLQVHGREVEVSGGGLEILFGGVVSVGYLKSF